MAKLLNRFKVMLFVSLSLNLLFCGAGGAYVVHKFASGGGANQSPYYEAYTSVFAEAVPPQQVDACFLGDSITQRGLFSEFFPGLAVSNRGIGSDTSEGVLKRLDTVVNGNPETVVLMIGVNDLVRGVQEDSIVSNVDKIVSGLESSLPDSRVVIMSVLPASSVDELKIRSLNNRYAEIAASHKNTLFLNLHDEYLTEEGSQDMSLYDADGVHLNGPGYKIWIDTISQLLKQ